jgi:hypothetical protein
MLCHASLSMVPSRFSLENLGQLAGNAVKHFLLSLARHVTARSSADISQTMPLIHRKLADPNLHV